MRPTAVISGAFGDVGNAIALRLAHHGYEIVALSHTTPPKTVKEKLAAFGPGAHTAYTCDFAHPEEIKEVMSKVLGERSVDVGIHAAWPKPIRKKLLDTTQAECEGQLRTGVVGGFLFLQTLAHHMRERKSGVLIGITTKALEESSGAMGAYVPAKFALYGVLKKLHEELEGSGVRVHAVAPGFMRAGMNKDLPERLFEMLNETTSLETLDDVSEKILRIIRDESSAFSVN